MKTFFLSIFLLLSFYLTIKAQNIELIGDTIELNLDGYKDGQIQWQFSADKQNWIDIKGATKEKLIYYLNEKGYFRVKVNSCNSEYITDTTFEIKTSSYVKKIIYSIKICRWKDDAKTCLNMSFDDNCTTHKQISEIFDQYGLKATFFVNAASMLTDSLKNICKRGHEIGNHTYSHTLNFSTEIDSSKIDFEIRNAKSIIEDRLKIKCVSFADPWHVNTPLSRKIVFKYHLFSRDYSEYNDFKKLSIDSTLKINNVMTYIRQSIQSHNISIICGHGIANDGYSPIKKAFLVQMLDSVKKYVDSGDIWVTTLKEGEQYDNLYHEVSMVKEYHGDTLKLNFENYNKEKYKDLETSPISIEIPYTISKEYSCLTDSIIVKKLADKFIFTIDLKKNTSLMLILKGLGDLYNFISK